jgi:hypothetical protein
MAPKRKALASINANTSKKGKLSKEVEDLKSSQTAPELGRKDLEDGSPDYSTWSVVDLKDELRKRYLRISGTRGEQTERLKQSDHDRSLPVKRAIEAEARKRRAQNPPKKHENTLEDIKQSDARYDEVRRNGPNGLPVYDDWGYALSHHKVSGIITSYNKASIVNGMDRKMERVRIDHEQKRKIMFGVANPKKELDNTIMDWQVAQDLEIALHSVEPCDYEEWKKQGFRANMEDFVVGQVDKELKRQLGERQIGSAFRK